MLYLHSLLVILFLQVRNGISSLESNKISRDLAQALEKGEYPNVLVKFTKGVTSAIERFKTRRFESRAARNSALKAELEQNAKESQQGVANMLSYSSGMQFKEFVTFWIENTMVIKEANYSTVMAVAKDLEVAQLLTEPVYKIPNILDDNTTSNGTSPRPPPEQEHWNLPKIQVSEAWAELNGSKGEGIIVAHIDTGVKHTHGLIAKNFRGAYGWFDGANGQLEPYDDLGHGTSTMSLLTGGTKGEGGPPIGVAPGATWMTCKGCTMRACFYEGLKACLQFMACPTLADGSMQDCSKAPHVLSYSLAGGREAGGVEENFVPVLKEMNIIFVAGIGNDGPNCDTAAYPANNLYVIGVGATTWEDKVWEGSSRGPTKDGRVKPDLVAPGAHVHIAKFNDNQDNFATYVTSGTSLATPHLAGVVALLKVREPELTFETAYKLLAESVDRVSYIEGESCSGQEGIIPNNLFGFGRVNALKALKAQTKLLAEKGK